MENNRLTLTEAPVVFHMGHFIIAHVSPGATNPAHEARGKPSSLQPCSAGGSQADCPARARGTLPGLAPMMFPKARAPARCRRHQAPH